MKCISLDAYFHMAAHGDEGAHQILYNYFKSRANQFIKIALDKMPKYQVNPADFADFVDILYFKILNDYDPNRGSVSNYIEYVLNRRLVPKVQQILIEESEQYTNFNEQRECNEPIETYADPNQKSFLEDIAINDFKLKISSPGNKKSNFKKMRDKILAMSYAGFTIKEICNELNITVSEYRWLLKKMKEDPDIINFKLEMK